MFLVLLNQREIITVKSLKSKRKKLTLTLLYYVSQNMVGQFKKKKKNSFALTNQDSTFSRTHENSKIFNITPKYFSFFNNKPTVS